MSSLAPYESFWLPYLGVVLRLLKLRTKVHHGLFSQPKYKMDTSSSVSNQNFHPPLQTALFKSASLLSPIGITFPKYSFTSSGYCFNPSSIDKKTTPFSERAFLSDP